jgi:hypothetical protein
MKSTISSQVFEWLLAHWAGFEENPAEVFPSLCDADLSDLQAQLDDAIRSAQTIKMSIPIEKIPPRTKSSSTPLAS